MITRKDPTQTHTRALKKQKQKKHNFQAIRNIQPMQILMATHEEVSWPEQQYDE